MASRTSPLPTSPPLRAVFSLAGAAALMMSVGCDRAPKKDPSAAAPTAQADAKAKPKAESEPGAAEPAAKRTDKPATEGGPQGAERPAADVGRDADRKPQAVLDFAGIKPGMTVADLQSGSGYYAELLAARVGPKGKVIAQNNEFVWKRFASKPMTERLARPHLSNVKAVTQELDALKFEAPLDAVLMVLFYHDTYWQKTDRARMNKQIFDGLKPGGTYLIVDHHAEAGSGDRDVETIHRVDAALVKKEILEAGFEFVAESDVLRHPEDPRTESVFKNRGKTDRFVYKFRRPAS